MDAWHEADCLDAKPRVNFGDDVVFKAEAKRAKARAAALMEAPPVVAGADEAVAWDPRPETLIARSNPL